MEIKDNKLIIDIPKGMEIDTENTDEEKGVIMFRKKNFITYEEVINLGFSVDVKNKIKAILKLMRIAKYYNEDWEPDWNDYYESKNYIYYKHSIGEYVVDADLRNVSNFVYFKNDVDAQAVIDNPNFRPIFDAIYKD